MSKLLKRILRAGVLPLALLLAGASHGADRVIRAQNMTVAPGQTNRLYIALESLGDENAVGFSVCFNTNFLTFISAQRGVDAVSAPQYIPNTNANQATNGRVGVLIGLSPPQTFAAGTNGLWEILFRAGSNSAMTTVSLCDTPVGRGVVDGSDDVNELPASYANATVSIQDPFACAYTNSITSRNHGHGATTNSVTVMTGNGCGWTISNLNTWITFPAGTTGTGTTTNTYLVEANSNLVSRTGIVMIAGQILTISQDPFECSFQLSPTKRTHGPGANSNSFSVVTAPLCDWMASTPNEWLTLVTGTNGPGSNTVGYLIASNPDSFPRYGAIFVGNQAFTITNSGADCEVDLSPTSHSHGFGSETGLVDVVIPGGCPWTVENTNSWIIIDSGASGGTGDGTIGYTVLSNSSFVGRSGVITIAGTNNFTVTQAPAQASCTIKLSATTRNHGNGAANNNVNVTNAAVDCAWYVINTNSWITLTGATNGLGNTNVTYSITANQTAVSRTGALVVKDQALVLIQAAGSCSFTLSPSSPPPLGSSASTNWVTNTVTTATVGCPWTISNLNSWITFPAGTNGTGTTTITYYVGTNLDSVPRTGVVMIANKVFTVIQNPVLGCSYTLSPTKRTHGPGAAANFVSVETDEGCAWTASTTTPWLTCATNGIGSSTNISYSVEANPDPIERVGSLLIGGKTFVITQQALVCSYTISPTNRNHGFGVATNTISVDPNGTGCQWNATTTNDWIALSGVTNGPGSNSFTYVLTANADSIGRTGIVFIANRFVTISQSNAPGCSYTLSPTKRTHGPGGTLSDDLEVRAPEGCAWTATTTTSWLGFVGATSGSGTTNVNYSVEPNPDPVERVGSLLIGGQTFVITQQALVCTYTISPTNRNHGFGAATNTISVDPNGTGCQWNATTTNDWIALSGITNGPGSNSFTYVLTANADSIGRTGIVFIANRFVTISQSNAPGCSYTLSPTKRTHGPGGTLSDDLEVRAPEGCAWTASTTTSWLGFVGATSGSGTTNVNYSVEPNPDPVERVGSLLIGGQTFVITQQALVCSFTISPTNRNHNYGPVTDTISVDPNGTGCQWNATTTNAWIALSGVTNGPGSNSFTYVLAPNADSIGRTGLVFIANRFVTISQSNAPGCSYTLSPTKRTHGPGAAANFVSVETDEGCAWTASTTTPWLTCATNGIGSSTNISYSVEANPDPIERVGSLLIGGKTFVITQQALVCSFTLSPTNLFRAHGHGAATNTIEVRANGTGCDWNATTTDEWITLSNASGFGSNFVTYILAANPTIIGRTGVVMIAGQTFAVSQTGAPCNYDLSPTGSTHGHGRTTNDVTLETLAGCPWTLTNANPWITISQTNDVEGTNIIFTYIVEANPFAQWRTGKVAIATEVFTIIQQPLPCEFTFEPPSAAHGTAAGSGSFSVTTSEDCPWTPTTPDSWITITSGSDSGLGQVTYTFPENLGGPRVGQIIVGGEAFQVTQQGPCTFLLVSNTAAYGPGPQGGSAAVTASSADCVWSVSENVSWITIQSAASITNSGIASYTVLTNDTAITRTGVLTIAGQSFTITQTGTTCSYQLSSTSADYGPAATNGSVTVTTPLGCTWAASSGAAWISVTANTNTGIASYTVLTNGTANTRIGILTIAGQSFTVTQTGTTCSYQLSFTSADYGAAATNGSVTVTTPLGCTWAASSGAVWISVTGNTNTGIASYNVLTNGTAITRIGVLSIAGHDFTITQTGTTCSYQLSSNSAAYGPAPANGSVTVTTPLGCTWAASSGAAWISVTANTNTGIASYTVQTNDTAITRIGVVTVAGQSFTITQAGAGCSHQLSSTSADYGPAATNGSVTVTTPLGCTWAASSGAAWISVTANTNTGIASYTVLTNGTANTRIGILTIAGQSFTVTQTGTTCSYQLSFTSADYGAAATNGSVTVTTPLGCTWAASSGAAWISVTANTNTGIASYNVLTNGTAITRIGVLSIAGHDFTITQTGTTCSYQLSSNSAAYGPAPANGSVTVTTPLGCTWAASSGAAWISVTANTNTGIASYTVQTNDTAITRIGVVTVAGQSFTITQAGAGCSHQLSSTSADYGPAATNGSVTVTTPLGCTWAASSGAAWISVTANTNTGIASYTVLTNGTANTRIGILTIAGQSFTVTQTGTTCSYQLSFTSADYGAAATNGSVTVTTPLGCTWAASSGAAWISVTANTNTGIASYNVLTNGTAITRIGVLSIAGHDFTITQTGTTCSYQLSSNSAAYGPAPANGSVTVTTPLGCTWAASSGVAWISVLADTNTGIASYSLLTNSTITSRTGVLTIAEQSFTVTQSGTGCSYQLSSNSAAYGPAPANGSVAVTTPLGCTWAASSSAAWISVLADTNTGIASYSVLTNGTAVTRTGVLSIAGHDFTITQTGTTCSYQLSSNSAAYGPAPANGSVTVTTPLGCTWAASSGAAWISVTANTNTGIASYSVLTNGAAVTRIGVLSIAGHDFAITQTGTTCSYQLSSTSADYGPAATNGSVAVTTPLGCTWAASSGVAWISVTANTNTGIASYSLLTNATITSRTGVLTIAEQSFTVTQSGAQCTFLLASNTATHGSAPETNSVAVTTSMPECTWSVSNGAPSWITILSSANNTNSGVVSYSVLTNSAALGRTGVVTIAGQDFTVRQAGAGCTFLLASDNAAHSWRPETNSVAVTTSLPNCTWSVSNGAPSWITIVSPLNNTGSTNVTYRVVTNSTFISRTGVITIAGQSFTVTQAGTPCTVALQWSNWVHGASSETGLVGVINVANCPWVATTTDAWITVTSGAGAGNGHVGYRVDENTDSGSRTGTVNIAGTVFTVAQMGTGCTYSTLPTSRFHGTGANANTISVTADAGCAWSVINSNSWITVLSNAVSTGSKTVGYSIAQNTSTTLRAGVINIAGEIISITQWGTQCGYAMTTNNRAHGFGPETNTVVIKASSSSCNWTVSNPNTWIIITTLSGSGDRTNTYRTLTNTSVMPRTGVFTVQGVPFTLTQAGAPCSFLLASNSAAYGSATQSGSVSVTTSTGCVWSVSSGVPWITIQSAANNTNSGIVSYSVDTNATVLMRTGVLSIAGQSFSITQTGAPCSFLLASNNAAHGSGTETGAVAVTTSLPDCTWSVSSATPSWITVLSAANNTDGGIVSYRVLTNSSSLLRTGVVIIAGQSFTVTQSGATCSFLLASNSAAHGSGTENGSVAVTVSLSDCTWSVSSGAPWISILSAVSNTNSGIASYRANPNLTYAARTGVVSIAGHAFTVVQAGLPCTYALSPTSASHSFAPATGSVSITTSNECHWTVVNTNSWITFTPPTDGFGSTTLNYSVETNANLSRSGYVLIGDVPFQVTQAGSESFIHALDMTVTRGQTNRLYIALESFGNENALGFSVCFDTNLLTFISAQRGADSVSAAQYITNINQSTAGHVGVLIGLSPPQTFSAGSNSIWEILFRAAAGSGSATTIVSFCDTPVGRGVVDGSDDVNELPSRFGDATVFIQAVCLYSLNTNAASFAAAGGSGSVSVTNDPGCTWSVQNPNSWITINSIANGTVTFAIEANPAGTPRSGTMTIAGQLFTVNQAGMCTFTISPASQVHGFTSETGLVSVAVSSNGCNWTVDNTNTWILITSNPPGSGSGDVGYRLEYNPNGVGRTGVVMIATNRFTLSQAANPCPVTLSPPNRSHAFEATNGSFLVTPASSCTWTGLSLNSWIQIISSPIGTGIQTLNYSITTNLSSAPRTGVIRVSGRDFVVTQEGACYYGITPTASPLFAFGGGSGSVVLDTTTNCSWTVQNTNSWVTFGSPNGPGGATLNYLVDSNTTIFSRTGMVRIADQVFKVTQSGIPCTFILSATEQTLNSLPRTNSVEVTAAATNCSWVVSSSNSWITFLYLSNYNGSATAYYSVLTNSSTTDRTGLVAVADQTLTIVQSSSPCAYTLSTNNLTLSSGNVTGVVSVTTSPNCFWVTVNTNSWLHIKAGTNGTGNGLVRYTADANGSPSLRSGNLTIGGQLHTVNQLGSQCDYDLSSFGRLHSSLLETGQVTVLPTSSECSWGVDNTNDWITFSATSGSGTLLLTYTVQPNPASVDRTGVVVIGNKNYAVTQFGAECNYSLLANSATHGGLSETGSITVGAPLGCTWNAVESIPWITILSGSIGTNDGTVSYSVSTNVTGASRSGVITINGRPFTVTQTPVFCSFTVAPATALHGFESETGLISVGVSNVCPWTIIRTNTWITFPTGINYTGSSNVSYSVTANPSSIARTSVVMVAGQAVTIRQAGLVCNYSLDPAGQVLGFRAATGQVAVASPTLCTWTVAKSNSWITILTTTNNTGSNTVRYAVSENSSATPRSGVITIAGQPFGVWQNGMPFIAPSNRVVLCGEPWDFHGPTLSGNCPFPGAGIYTLSTITNLGCGPTFTATRIWEANDACGVHMLSTQTVSVITLPPVMSCAPNKAVECGSAWTFDAPTANDFCSGANLPVRIVSTITSTNGMCGSSFKVTRTWEATNSCGDVSSCSQAVSVVDTTPPVPTCAPSKTVECGTAWNFDAPTAFDACSGTNATIRVFSTVTNGIGSCSFTATRTWEMFDACTNRSTCVQTVTVVDTTPPVMTCSPAKTVECGTAWNFDPPTASDNCVGPDVTILVFTTVTNTASSCGSSFMATRTWEALDGCGNMNFCSQTVRVVDTTPPTVTCAANKTVEFGQAWNFDAPTGTDSCAGINVTLRIVSTVTNASCGSTLAAIRTWEVSDGCSNNVNCTQTVTVRDTTPPVITCAPSKAINCLAPWTFDTPTAIDVASGASATVTVLNSVTNGSCGSGFTATRTWRATDSCGNSATCSQTVSGRAIVSVSGTVYSPTNYPATITDKRVAGATVLGPTNMVGTTAADGSYNCVFDAASNVVITPLAPSSGNPIDGVSTLGISHVRLHILSVSNLNSPYKLLAADVDGDGTVSALDLSFMRRLILGTTNRFPAGLWRFVPANFAFPNVLNPWSAPTNRTYGGVASDLAGQDFVAIKLGDVNNAWTPPSGLAGFKSAPAKDGSSVVSFEVNGATNLPGSSVVVQVAVGGFSQVTSVQGTLAWDPAVIRFAGTEGYGLAGLAPDNFGTNQASSGKLVFSWDDPVARGITAPDGTVMFAVRFDVIGTMGSVSPVRLLDSIAVREVGVNFTAVTFRAVDGQVRVMEPPALRLSQGLLTRGVYALTVPTVSGKRYILEYTDNLPAASWTALPAVMGDGKINILSDPAPSPQKRFYRLKVE